MICDESSEEHSLDQHQQSEPPIGKQMGKPVQESRENHESSDLPRRKYRRLNYSTLAHKVQRQMINI
jgi:hypothetical protein